jgi:hypothetical protein
LTAGDGGRSLPCVASKQRYRLVIAASLMAAHGAASACLPPPDDWVPPTRQEQVASVARSATDIVEGVVTRGSYSGRTPRFRILHVYRGSLRPGMTISIMPGWGLHAPMCAGMISPPPVPRGARGVIYFRRGDPELNFLWADELEMMFAGGWIARRPADPSRSAAQ